MSTKVAYAIVLGVAVVVTFALMPLCRRLAVRVGAVVAPDERRVHETPTPLLGGVAMLGGFLAAMFVAWRLDALGAIFDGATEPIGVVLAAVVMLVICTVDDVREVSAPARIAGTVLCAAILVYFGISMLVFRVPFAGIIVLSPDWSFLLSVLWVIGMTQAVNLIDGLDGLAAGIVAIASGTFFLYSLQLTDAGVLQVGNIAPLVAIIVLGMCVGYLPWNVHPAKIFMGDGGAYMLGLLMAASTMAVGGRTDQEFSGQTYFFFAPLFIPLFILAVPIIDVAFAIVRRASKRGDPTVADKEHIHHRLMRLGHGYRRTVWILWGWTAVLSALVLYPAYTGQGNGLVPIGIVALVLALYTVLHPGLRSARAERDADAKSDADAETDADAAGEAGVGPPERSTGASGARPDGGQRAAAPAPEAAGLSPDEALAAFDASTEDLRRP